MGGEGSDGGDGGDVGGSGGGGGGEGGWLTQMHLLLEEHEPGLLLPQKAR